MAAKAFSKEDIENLAMIGLPKSYQRVRQIPLDPTDIFASYEDAEAYALGNSEQFGDIAIVGQLISVVDISANTVTAYKIGIGGTLEPIGGEQHAAEEADNYTAACAMATSDNIGQIINVLHEEAGSGSTVYSAGLYIVTGAEAVAKLGTTSAGGDIAGDVEMLKGRMGTAETNIASLSGTMETALYWETDEDNE